mmetsp:Transcript_10427/g.36401  ORF Transcript_10427/g.36401 Transcript_10427/m.36401 type:complete len:172 (-) Transcript_10427:55-570(-)
MGVSDLASDVFETLFSSKRRMNEEQLVDLYRRRALVVFLFAVLSLWAGAWVVTDRTESSQAASDEWQAVNYLTGACDVVVALMFVSLGYVEHKRMVSGAACVTFGLRSAAFAILQVVRLGEEAGDEEPSEWAILLCQTAFTVVILYFSYTGWKRFVQLKAGSSSDGAPILP